MRYGANHEFDYATATSMALVQSEVRGGIFDKDEGRSHGR